MENEKIAEFLKVIREALDMLREFQSVRLEGYRKDRKVQDIVEREFERAILACIDIGARIISIRGFSPASSYVEVFDVLHRNGVLPEDLAEEMQDLARFRNVLAHEYFRINPDIVHQNLQNSLERFVTFSRCVVGYL